MPARQSIAIAAVLFTLALPACDDGGSPPLTTVTPASPTTCPGTLSSESIAHIQGGFEVDYLADRYSLATGDFNGDGVTDLLAGSPLADGPDDTRLNTGEAHVLFGSRNLPAESDTGTGLDVVIYGQDEQDNFALSVAAGDVNGDGIDDIIGGSRFASAGDRGEVGQTYVIFGRRDLGGAIDLAAGEQDVTITGIDAGDFSGFLVYAADLTSDGIDDLIVGAPAGSGPENDKPRAGELYLLPGGQALADVDLSAAPPFLTVYGAGAEDFIPGRLAAADFNDDGRNDLIIGAPMATPRGDTDLIAAGAVYVIEVPEGGGVIDLATDETVATVVGASQRDGLGHSLAIMDFNDDGVADFLAGARDADGEGGSPANVGQIVGLHGSPDSRGVVDLNDNEPDLRITGGAGGGSLGFSMAAEDVTGDGKPDLVAAAPLAGGCGDALEGSGNVYVIDGDKLEKDVNLSDPGPVWKAYYGEGAGDEAGFSLATGDLNADAIADVVIGALLADGPDDSRQDAGEIFVVPGG